MKSWLLRRCTGARQSLVLHMQPACWQQVRQDAAGCLNRTKHAAKARSSFLLHILLLSLVLQQDFMQLCHSRAMQGHCTHIQPPDTITFNILEDYTAQSVFQICYCECNNVQAGRRRASQLHAAAAGPDSNATQAADAVTRWAHAGTCAVPFERWLHVAPASP